MPVMPGKNPINEWFLDQQALSEKDIVELSFGVVA